MQDLEQRVIEVIDTEINPLLEQHGGACSLVGVKDGVVTISFQGGCASCPSRNITLLNGVAPILKARISSIKDVVLG